MSKVNRKIIKESIKNVWHPCSRMDQYNEQNLIAIESGNKSWLRSVDGKDYFDAISSWWVNLFGHNNPFLKKYITTQLNKIEHVMLSGMTHQPVIELSKRLNALANMDHCFYSSDGSSAVEVALKVSYHYWKNKRQKKTKFALIENSYHGETLGALSVTDVDIFSKNYHSLLNKNIILPNPSPKNYESEKKLKEFALESFKKAEVILNKHHKKIAGLIIEPILQCASGMNYYHPIYLKKLRALCSKLDIHLIADEIAVGFGRTGKMFACQHANVKPDIMCLSKGLSGGYLPLAATLVSKKIYQEFLNPDIEKNFLHSHSFTGNPLACSAAIATLDYFNKKLSMDKTNQKSQLFDQIMKKLTKYNIRNFFNIGMIWRFDLPETQESMKFESLAREEGLLIRPIGKCVYIMPPYTSTLSDIKFVVKVLEKIFKKLQMDIK
jgi:adenosylmethionine---8-amino-7-oxononanoate aminotransferase